MKTGFERIQEERERQISSEGWTEEDDDVYVDGQLAVAADCYFRNNNSEWPWHPSWWKPSTDERNLEKAGALYLAERDRWKRMGFPDIAKLTEQRAVSCGIRLDEIAAERRRNEDAGL